MSSEYCRACLRKHRSGLWYGSGDFVYCTASYQRMLRQEKLAHPSWPVFRDQVHATDSTGACIAAAAFRPDVKAIADASVLLTMYPRLRRHKLFISILAAQYYYSWPMHMFVHQLGAEHTGAHLDVSLVRARVIGQELLHMCWLNVLIETCSEALAKTLRWRSDFHISAIPTELR